jgi:hypothetical protein
MKRELIFILVFLIFFNASLANAVTMHNANNVSLNIDTASKTLQQAADQGLLRGHTYSSPTSVSGGEHNISQIWISVYSGEMNLLQALQQNKLCPKATKPLTYSGPSDKSQAYHPATEINISFGSSWKSFQQAINEGKFNITTFECYDNDVYSNNSCGNSMGKYQECGDSSCGDYGAEYCNSNQHAVQDRTCHDRGCSNGACFDTTRTETKDNGDAPIYWCIENEPDTGGGKVICTELYTTGVLDDETYQMDVKYAAEHFSKGALKGYQAWAIPVVKAMRKSPEEAKRIVIPLVNAFMEEIAYRSGKSGTGNEVGKLFLDEGVPIFERIGKYINEPDWKSLFTQKQFWILENKFLFYYIYNFKSILQESKYDTIVKDYFTEEKVREMFYDAERRGGNSQLAVAEALIENLEDAVEEIETMIKSVN